MMDPNKTTAMLYQEILDYDSPLDGMSIPPHTAKGLASYIIDGRPPGDFLHAVLTNNLTESIGRADHLNLEALLVIASYVYNHAPSICWRTEERIKVWIAKGGLKGIHQRTEMANRDA